MEQRSHLLQKKAQTSTESKILEYLRQYGSATLPILCRMLGVRPLQAAWTLVGLEEKGRIVSIPHGKVRQFALATRTVKRRVA
ncbi:MAG: hypothetical protein HY684_05775 [Chloroflexi bacterium]|nr:hypothetical protein [Chloroflexota bacterium]